MRPVVIGLMTYIPGFYRLLRRTGGTDNPRYCYSVWLRHLVAANDRKVLAGVPQAVAEIGPGDSIGIGLAALLSGVHEYSAIDVVKFTSPERNLYMLRQLIRLFKERTEIPDDAEFPLVSPRLNSYAFPSQLVTDDMLGKSLSDAHIEAIASSITAGTTSNSAKKTPITYVAPWTRTDILPRCAFDMIYSQAVLEHVDQLDELYNAMYTWLKRGGVMSHDIDFSHHRIGPLWNSHWTYSDRAWRVIRGRRAWLINRQPHSRHIAAIRRSGFDLIADVATHQTNEIKRADLSAGFRELSDDDLTTAECYVLAVRR